jgi:hypothetical protein
VGLETGERHVSSETCDTCGVAYDLVRGFVYRDGDAYAVYVAACHGHSEHEAFLDVVLGTWGDDDVNDRVTFSARVRHEGATAIDAPAAAAGESDVFGTKLTRDEALAHPKLSELWDVVDHVVVEDPGVAAVVYGAD